MPILTNKRPVLNSATPRSMPPFPSSEKPTDCLFPNPKIFQTLVYRNILLSLTLLANHSHSKPDLGFLDSYTSLAIPSSPSKVPYWMLVLLKVPSWLIALLSFALCWNIPFHNFRSALSPRPDSYLSICFFRHVKLKRPSTNLIMHYSNRGPSSAGSRNFREFNQETVN